MVSSHSFSTQDASFPRGSELDLSHAGQVHLMSKSAHGDKCNTPLCRIICPSPSCLLFFFPWMILIQAHAPYCMKTSVLDQFLSSFLPLFLPFFLPSTFSFFLPSTFSFFLPSTLPYFLSFSFFHLACAWSMQKFPGQIFNPLFLNLSLSIYILNDKKSQLIILLDIIVSIFQPLCFHIRSCSLPLHLQS